MFFGSSKTSLIAIHHWSNDAMVLHIHIHTIASVLLKRRLNWKLPVEIFSMGYTQTKIISIVHCICIQGSDGVMVMAWVPSKIRSEEHGNSAKVWISRQVGYIQGWEHPNNALAHEGAATPFEVTASDLGSTVSLKIVFGKIVLWEEILACPMAKVERQFYPTS